MEAFTTQKLVYPTNQDFFASREPVVKDDQHTTVYNIQLYVYQHATVYNIPLDVY